MMLRSLSILGATSVLAAADVLVRPVAAAATSTQAGTTANALIDGSGLSNVGGRWVHGNRKSGQSAAIWNSDYTPEGQVGKVMVFLDLGAVKQVTGLWLWNGNEQGFEHRSVKEVEVSLSTDGREYAAVGLFSFAKASGTDGERAQEILFARSPARFIRLLVLSNHSHERIAAISEIAPIIADAGPGDRLVQ